MKPAFASVLIGALTLALIVACGGGGDAPPAPDPTPDVDATVQAGMEATRAAMPDPTPDINVTVEAGKEATRSAMPDPTPVPAPTPAPVATPIPAPTATPVPPTPIPEPTATPMPTPTAHPQFRNQWRQIKNSGWMDRYYSSLTAKVKGWTWVRDGLNSHEIEGLSHIFQASEPALHPLLRMKWVEDGLTTLEVSVLDDLVDIDFKNSAVALRLISMPFLESLEPPDKSALDALADMVWFEGSTFEKVWALPAVQAGITDELAKVVVVLSDVYARSPDGGALVEERSIVLPLAGEVQLTVIRLEPGAKRSMDLLEAVVRHAEQYMGTPFPTSYVVWAFVYSPDDGSEGSNYGTHIASLPELDTAHNVHTLVHIAHEVAHYYWRGNIGWIDEGAAEFLAMTANHNQTGSPMEVTAAPCSYADSISTLEELPEANNPDSSQYSCNYFLGESLFLALYDALGRDAMREGMRQLYAMSQAPAAIDSDDEVNMDDVEVVFSSAAASDVLAYWFYR